MRRGTVVVVATKGPYTGKPRPAVVVQDAVFNETHASITVCPVTSELVDLGWQLEECRVATFAQSLGVKGGASVAKASKALTRLGA